MSDLALILEGAIPGALLGWWLWRKWPVRHDISIFDESYVPPAQACRRCGWPSTSLEHWVAHNGTVDDWPGTADNWREVMRQSDGADT